MAPSPWDTKLFRPPGLGLDAIPDVYPVIMGAVPRPRPPRRDSSEPMPLAAVHYTISTNVTNATKRVHRRRQRSSGGRFVSPIAVRENRG